MIQGDKSEETRMNRRRGYESNRVKLFRHGSRYQPYIPVCIAYVTSRQCTRGDRCPLLHEMPKTPISCSALYNAQVLRLAELAENARNMRPLQPPENQSIKMLYIGRINSSVLEQDIRDHFCTYGEIESIRFFAHREVTCVFLTYTTRQAAEKAMLGLSNWVDINGQRLRLSWGPDQDFLNRALARGALISTQEQQATKSYIRALEQKIQGAEKKQRQMMSFLARAMQSPTFLLQLLKQRDKRIKELEDEAANRERGGSSMSELEALALEMQGYGKQRNMKEEEDFFLKDDPLS